MDRNGVMDRRFSLNMTQLPNPIAESTCLNINGTSVSVGGGNKSDESRFRWGGTPISPKHRSNSSICLNAISMHKNKTTANSPQRSRMDLSKIDPRTYADVRSRGLVSRIVQYHENGARLNRSMSAGNLYNKSGQSSLTQLQKSDLPYRATQQNVSMTRMAPTKKPTFYGNTLSSLLRSNSVISVQKSDEEISCENRPILHPPPTENDLAPTRSVLDVLKEISRKRINSDDSEPIHDANKKYCSRDCSDAPYDPSAAPMATRNMGIHGMVPPMASPVQSYKRQREHILPPQQYPINYSQNMNSVSGATNYPTARPPLQAQYSPEQIAKKRLCSYNNDITSSLSSSLIHANKRKFYEQQQRSTIQRSPTNATEDYETQKSKIHRQQSDLRFQQMQHSLSCNSPITPIPATPLSQNNNMPPVPSSTQNATEEIVDITTSAKRSDLETGKYTIKPKVTLFNRNYNESTSLNNVNDNNKTVLKNSVDQDYGECADIQFVKPKKSSAIVNKKNPLIERTQKSKLAMMLSGLRGEIYQGENGDDEVDKSSDKDSGKTTTQITVLTATDKQTSKVVSTSASTATTITTTTPASFAMKMPDKSVTSTTSDPRQVLSKSDNTSAVTSISVAATSNSSMPGSSTTSTVTTMSSPLSGFKLTASTANTSITTNTTTSKIPVVTPAKSTSPLVGLKLTPQKPEINFGMTGNSTAPTFNFSAITTTSAPAIDSKAVTSTTSALPQLHGFSFNTTTKSSTSPPASTNTSLTTAAQPTTTERVGGFKFGINQQSGVSLAATTAAATSSFGGFANSTTPTSNSKSSETLKPLLAFGSNPPSTTAAVLKPTVNFGSSTTTTTASGFNAVTSGAFIFAGVTNNSPKPSVPLTDTQVTASTAQSANTFGSIVTSSELTMPTLGSAPNITLSNSSLAAKPSFSFGGSAVATSNAGAPISTNLFAFGGQKSTATTITTTTSTVVAPFSFGSTTQTPVAVPSTAATQNATANNAIFSFGGDNKGAAKSLEGASSTSTAGGNLFSFGGVPANNDNKLFGNTLAPSNNTQTIAPTPVQSNTFTFGSVTGQGTVPAFGGMSAAPSAPGFGAPTTTSVTPFAFGGGTNMTNLMAAPTVAPASNTTSGGFNFGTAATGTVPVNNATSTNIFGAAAASIPNNAASSMSKPAFNFGGTSSDTAKSIFGGSGTTSATNNSSSSSAFGALSNAANNQTTKTFSFGGNTNSSSINTTSNSFGATTNKPSTTGFSFASGAMGNKPTATVGAQSSSSTPFAFGGSANTNQSASSTATPFGFGGSTSGAPANKTFSFGSNSNVTAVQTPNPNSIFGGGLQNATNAQQGTAAPFNFSAGATATLTASSSTANIFASPTPANGVGGGAATDRPIRRATRRLQKT
ncbi:nuclear pore complex protein DDB_G0274915 [Ceratitis capitata]|uniref:nuclear pore complex protein DDB_G0274915 n=1 Tax=Ceratitis capitata TaxID=7213 RepID=UPI00032A1A0E|nr:nuclear pore complex protein DDB_G0274915 [Ceratitis capitata]